MAGIFFDYTPGRIDARFEHGDSFDFIDMRIRMLGATVTETTCDDQFKKGEPVDYVVPVLEFTVYMSSVWCPFTDYIRFLEAMVIQVKKCSFTWDAEGPDGEMKWVRRFVNKDGFLTIEWSGRDEELKHRMHLETRQTVSMLYNSFRHFVESPEYDPLRYEELPTGEVLVEGLGLRYSEDEIIEHFKYLELPQARKLFFAIVERAGHRNGVPHEAELWPEETTQVRQPVDFDQCLALYGDSAYEETDRYIPDDWAKWNAAERESDMKNFFAKGILSSWHGARLRDMRSTIVEKYLAQVTTVP